MFRVREVVGVCGDSSFHNLHGDWLRSGIEYLYGFLLRRTGDVCAVYLNTNKQNSFGQPAWQTKENNELAHVDRLSHEVFCRCWFNFHWVCCGGGGVFLCEKKRSAVHSPTCLTMCSMTDNEPRSGDRKTKRELKNANSKVLHSAWLRHWQTTPFFSTEGPLARILSLNKETVHMISCNSPLPVTTILSRSQQKYDTG